ncbi:MAG: pyruvate kinase, partial [Acidobacteriota bacterium]
MIGQPDMNDEGKTNLICRLRLQRRAKIVATIGPASRTLPVIRELAHAGLDVARINMSHGSHAEHAQAIGYLRAVSEEMHKPIAILMDLCGPKIRTGQLKGGQPIELVAGNLLTITIDPIEGDATCISAHYPYLIQDLRVGDQILLDDGLIDLTVEEKHQREIVCRVVHGSRLSERKGINLPGVPLSIPSLTEKDKKDLEFGIQQRVDYVALSFVRSAQDCQDTKALIEQLAKENNSHIPPLIAKIEKREALKVLDDILEVADGIMVARGDLGVETAAESVPVYQKELIRKANRIGKLVITATQMLQSMIENPRPTRAEASDVANAVLDGTDAVMLSGETAAGAYPVEAVRTMDRIVRYTEEAIYKQIFFRYDRRRRELLSDNTGSYGRALAEAATFAADEIAAPLIVVFTESGYMAQHVVALRPKQEIIAFTPVLATYRRLAAIWGTESFLLQSTDLSDQLFTITDKVLTKLNLVQPGETVVMVAGSISGVPLSNMVKLHRVNLL